MSNTGRVKWTTTRIRALKGKQKIAALTAYDYSTARLVDEAEIPIVLVGDSLGMVMLGYETTLPVTMEEMLHHTAGVVRGVEYGLVVADMPFLSYQSSISQAVENAGRFLKEAGAQAVKIEGGVIRRETIRALEANGIPVMGHIGLTPQSVRQFGGYKVQGRTTKDAQKIMDDARAVAEAGVFSLVLEGIPHDLAREITAQAPIPTIGIGAGPHCDGQVLVVHDMLGLYGEFAPKFVKRYAHIGQEMKRAFVAYRKEVEAGQFPGAEHSY